VTTPTTVQVRLKLRRDTAANWTTANPVLLAGELGLESDTNKIKIGDGTTAWTSLGYFPFVVSGGVVTGNLEIGTTGTLTFEGSTANNFETTLGVVDPTADRTINLPNVSGTIITTGDTGTVTSTMLADGTIVNADVSASAAIAHSKLANITAGYVLIGNASNVPTATQVTGDVTISSGGVTAISSGVIVDGDISASAEIAVSKLADGAARQLLQTDAAGTGVEWTSNVDVPGTLDVTGAATFDSSVTITGDLTVNGTTTNINTQNLVVEDKNVILGDVATPSDTTANGGGITLKGATDKTITWSDTTDSWEFNQPTITTGSSTAASFIPTSSTVPTNGVYLPSSNNVAISTNGTGRLFVDASGRVTGQGFSSYRGNTHTIASFAANTTLGPLNIVQGNIGTHPSISAGQNSSGTYASLGLLTSDKYRLLIDPTGLSTFTSDTSTAPVIVNIGASEVACIDSSGRLLVGTSSATGNALLQVAGDALIQSLNGGPLAGARNRIINGDMRISQRNAGASVTVSSYGYVLDRWGFQCSGGGQWSAQRSTTAPAGFTNSLALTVSTVDSSIAAADVYQVFQKVEGFNAADLAFGTASASTITVSFWVRSSITGTYSASIQNNAFNRGFVSTFTIDAANTWEKKSLVIAGDTSGTWATDNTIGLQLAIDLGSGSSSNVTAGSWQTVSTSTLRTSGSVNWISNSGATFLLTGVQLEAGTVATPFERRSYGQELALCQRYFETGRNSICVGGGTQGTLTDVKQTSSFATTKRIAVWNGTTSGVTGTVASINTFVDQIQVNYSAGVSNNFTCFWTASAEL